MAEEQLLETRLKNISTIHSNTSETIAWGIDSLPDKKNSLFYENNLKARIQLMHLDTYVDLISCSLMYLAQQEYKINKNNFGSDKIEVLPPPISKSYSALGNFICYANNIEPDEVNKLTRTNPALFKYINEAMGNKGTNEIIGYEREIAENGGEIKPGSVRNVITYKLQGMDINAFNHLQQRYQAHMNDVNNILELNFKKEGRLLKGPWKHTY